MESDDERGQVEWDIRGARVGFPDEEGLIGARFVQLSRFEFRVFEAWSQAGVDLVVPAAADAPFCLAVLACHLTVDLIRRRCFPAARLEIERADLASGPILDFHGAVVVNGG